MRDFVRIGLLETRGRERGRRGNASGGTATTYGAKTVSYGGASAGGGGGVTTADRPSASVAQRTGRGMPSDFYRRKKMVAFGSKGLVLWHTHARPAGASAPPR